MAEQGPKLYSHWWTLDGPGTHERWSRYKCRKCDQFAQFHDNFPIKDQPGHDKRSCPLIKVPPTAEEIARYQKGLEARNAD